jgi:MFS transporter, DHA2 family, multidrug resistance protein
MVALLYGIIEGAERGWTDGLVLGAFAAAVALVGGFLAWESRAEHPMLPLWLFRDRRFSVASAAITLTFFALFGFYFLTTLYLQYVLGYSPLTAGLAGLPLAGAMIVVAPRSASLGERFGAARVITGGFTLMAVGLALFTRIGVDTPYPIVALGFVLLGAGLAATAAPATGMLMSAVPLDKAGVGSAVNDTTREFGGALGIAVFGTLVGSAYRSNMDLSGTDVPAGAARAADESIGAAWGVAQGLPGGEALLAQAQSAFVDAFRLTNLVSVAVAVLAAAFVWTALRPGRGDPAEAESDDRGDEPAFDAEAGAPALDPVPST